MAWYGSASPISPADEAEEVVDMPASSSAAGEKVSDPSAWVRSYMRSCEAQYRRWVQSLHDSRDEGVKYQWWTDAEFRKAGVPPRLPCESPAFGTEKGLPWIVFHKHPDLVPIGHAEWQEFNRRIRWLGCTPTQGVELRRRAREVGVKWP